MLISTQRKNTTSTPLHKMNYSKKILLFGTGNMAYEYARVLNNLELEFIVIGRGIESAKMFEKKTGIKPFTGGADKFLKKSDYSSYSAIVAVTGNQLGNVTIDLINHGVRSILVEKPGGIDGKEIKLVGSLARKNSANIYIAYNRRFYSSVKKAQDIIEKDGGVLSFHFEFNELSDQISKLKAPVEIKNRWLLHNSTHVIDLAFFLAGNPKTLKAQSSHSLPWHPKGAVFVGHGLTKDSTPFTYHANWLSPGRWGLEIMTKNHRLIFKPLEKLQLQKKGSFELTYAKLDDKLDNDYKPGLYKEVESFLGKKKFLCQLEEQVGNLTWFNKILEGKT